MNFKPFSNALSMGFLALLTIAGTLRAQDQLHYTVTDLGTLGGAYSDAYGINAAGVVAGGAATASQTNGLAQTAFLWNHGKITSLGTLGGSACPQCSSEASGPNDSGEVALLSETALHDQNGEDFCGFGTHLQCLAATWKKGVTTPCPISPAATMPRLTASMIAGKSSGWQRMGSSIQPALCLPR